MALVTTAEILLAAQQGGYAVPAFNMENMEMAQGIVAAAEEQQAPVILQTTPGTLRYGDIGLYFAIAKALAEKAIVPVAVHLDHGSSFSLAAQALRAGYTSVMIDGSPLPLEENIQVTRKVVDMAKAMGVPVEAELGQVGGKEDGMDGGDGGYTNPKEAAEFVKRTDVSSLAVAIGTAHGVYTGPPQLDLNRLEEIRQVVDIPLVLHGASGIGEKDIKACIARGVCKVNIATELRIAYTRGVTQGLAQEPAPIDPKVYSGLGRQQVKETAAGFFQMCGTAGRAN